MFHKMFKNLVIVILSILVIFFWLGSYPEDDDPDDVTIEYKCSVIKEYRHVPPEVLEECRNRNGSPKEIDDNPTV